LPKNGLAFEQFGLSQFPVEMEPFLRISRNACQGIYYARGT